MKKLFRYVSLVVALSLLLCIPVYAADGRSMEASQYFSYTDAYLAKGSGTTFYICFDVIGTGSMDEIGVSYIELQTSTDDVNWSPIRYYYKSSYNSMIDKNTGTHAGSFTYTGVQNNYYRAYVEFYAKDDSGQGYYTTYTSSIKVP